MKQVITAEQLQELSEEQKERLREWWFKHIKVGDVFIVDGKVLKDGDVTIGPNPLLSVGQCIELLQEKCPNGIAFHNDWGEIWTVLAQDTQNDDPPDSFISRVIAEDHDLIDALWEAVKAVL